jgi:hypothetical protein
VKTNGDVKTNQTIPYSGSSSWFRFGPKVSIGRRAIVS